MGEIFGIALEYVLAAAGGLIAIVVAGLVLRSRKRKALQEEERQALEELAEEQRGPTRDVLEDRKTVSGPVEIDDSMSLREIRELKRARLDDDYKESRSSQAAKEWRKGAQDRPLDEEEESGFDAEETVPAAPMEPEVGDDSADAQTKDTVEIDTNERPTVDEREPSAEVKEAVQPKEGETTERPALSEKVAAQTAADTSTTMEAEAVDTDVDEDERAPDEPKTLEAGLEKTRTGFLGRITTIFSSHEELDDDVIEEVEEVLFTADIGAKVSQQLLMAIEERMARADSSDPELVWAVLRDETEKILESNEGEFVVPDDTSPFVTLVVGVNGVGKTTTIGKLAARYQREGKKVMMVAGDTFRAAAVEQLEEWANRVGCGFHQGEPEADPSSVIYDGIERAREENYDIVLCDTAGRLHTRAPLVDELKKIHRVCGKAEEGAPHETLLVLDANTGQNAIQQAKLFGEAVDVTGIVLTKLDGTAKGGVILGICKDLGVPVYFIGIGEGVRDLRPFHSGEFVDALFA